MPIEKKFMTDMSLDDVKRNCRRSLQLVPHRHRKGRCIMTELQKFIAKCEANSVPDSQINFDDVPEVTEEDFARGHFKYMRESDVSQLIAECEKNAVPDELIDTSEIPEITSLDGFYKVYKMY